MNTRASTDKRKRRAAIYRKAAYLHEAGMGGSIMAYAVGVATNWKSHATWCKRLEDVFGDPYPGRPCEDKGEQTLGLCFMAAMAEAGDAE
jgi:hypothetical protein